MSGAWNWIMQNRTWLFSGAGLSAIAVAWLAITKLIPNSPNRKTDPSGTHVDINVSPNISPTNSNVQSNMDTSDAAQWQPDIKAVNCKAAVAAGLGGTGKSFFVMSFRNDGWVDATSIVAHIGFSGSFGQRMLVDYGAWIEHQPIINIFRGHTKNLIMVVTDAGKNFAVTDIAPATNYTNARLEEVGEVTPGDWKMIITLSADNFRREYLFDVTVGHDASFLCNPEGTGDRVILQNTDETVRPNVGSLRPEITTVSYDCESDTWSKSSVGDAVPAALLAFSNTPCPS